MLKEFTNPEINANFGIATEYKNEWVHNGSYLMFLWNDGSNSIRLSVDDKEVILSPNRISCTTYLNKVQIDNSNKGLKILFFNREFYCVHTYDSEVSCNGLLFFGSNIAPVLQLNEVETERLRTLFDVLKEEFTIHDSNQEEMLRILLKRFIIRCTRMANLNNKEKEVINLVVSQVNGCSYCQAAHTAIGKMNGFSEEQTVELRQGKASFNEKFDALAKLTKAIAENSGNIPDDILENFFNAGYTKENLIDVIVNIGEKATTNYLHNVTKIPVDFPAAPELTETVS